VILRGLGLTRLHKTVVVNDTLAIRGMIRKVSHLITVEPVE
jgi:large subunit ribosomal protein L30